MDKINWGRVLLGGVVAGTVIFILETLQGYLFAAEWKAATQGFGRSMQETSTTIVLAVVLTFGVGTASVWLYAVARPRFEPGPKTAALTGLGYWFIGYLLPSMAWTSLVGFPTRLAVIATFWALPEIILATIAGAWPYKE